MTTSRNKPCPCGSGKKFKKCCGASLTSFSATESRDCVALNRAIAYEGKLGREREEFCRNYVIYKQSVFKEMGKKLYDKVASNGETITCHKGCCYCCSQYVGGRLQESEAIVYYFYQHETALTDFLLVYPGWREKVRLNEQIFLNVQETYNKCLKEGFTEQNSQAFGDANEMYLNQNISCPFLNDNACSIYEVRPWCCASIVATTLGEWCSPLNQNVPNVYVFGTFPKEPSYFRQTEGNYIFAIPLSVYEILNGGYIWLSKVPGLEGIDKEIANDYEVKPIVQRYLDIPTMSINRPFRI